MSYVYKKKFMNLKIISLSERIQIKKEPIVLFHLYKIIEKVSSPKVIESKSAVVWGHKKPSYLFIFLLKFILCHGYVSPPPLPLPTSSLQPYD